MGWLIGLPRNWLPANWLPGGTIDLVANSRRVSALERPGMMSDTTPAVNARPGRAHARIRHAIDGTARPTIN